MDYWEGLGGGLGCPLCSIFGVHLTGVEEEVEGEEEGRDEDLNEGEEGCDDEEGQEGVEAKGPT